MERLAAREFEFANGKMTTPSMCGPARHLLLPYVAKLRAGEQIHTVSLACPVVAGNELDFEMRPRESIAA
jgi:hypothetical protein